MQRNTTFDQLQKKNVMNKRLRALIIDDELSGRTMIEFYIKEYLSELIGETVAVADLCQARKEIDTFNPDIVFSDIELRGENGLNIYNDLNESIPVVIVSAHSHYALKAIHQNVFDYLLKPLTESEIERFKIRLENKLTNSHSSTQKTYKVREENLIIKDGGESIMIPYAEIHCIEACGAYSKIVTEKRNYIASKTLKHIEDLLPKDFVRVHRSYIVPLHQIKSYSSSHVCLKNGQSISVSKTGRKQLQEQL